MKALSYQRHKPVWNGKISTCQARLWNGIRMQSIISYSYGSKGNFGFQMTQAQNMAVLRWDHIAFGAVAFINGQEVGENEPIGPYQVIIPENVLKAGENEIVLKIASSKGGRRAKSGYFLK